jgi:site-specific DNA recombinase
MAAKRSDKSKRIGIWLRVSTEDQVRGESPETHEKRARLVAEAKGWSVIEVYRLDAVSGKTVKEHPETKRMLADVKKGHVSGLIFSKLARLARNTKELLEFADWFNQHDADLISLAESIDTSSPAGKLFYTMIAAMAQWEREEISARVAASVPVRAQMGKPLGGAAPFGYQWKDKQLVIDEKEAPVRKLMYELFREHKRKKTVARMLNDRGFRTRNGSEFSDTTTERLLRDPAAKGLRRANYTSSLGDGKAWELKPKEEWVIHEVEPIVSEALWAEVNAILDQQRGSVKKPARKVVHLFAGIAYCFCGEKMYVPSNSPKYTCYRCRNKIPANDLEAVFHEQLRGFLLSSDEIRKHLEAGSQKISHGTELLTVLEGERERLTIEEGKLYALYQSGAIDSRGYGLKYKPLSERLAQLDDEIPKTQAELDVLKISLHSQEEVMAEARDLFAQWPSLPQEEKRTIIETITERITIGDGDVEITLLYDPPRNSSPPESEDGPPPSSSGTPGILAMKPQGFIAATS